MDKTILNDVKGKKLLVLGGTTASYDLVKNAREMGVYTLVTDDCEDRISKKIADESAMVSTTDIDGLVELIKEKDIDGVFCGPSEFNIRNVIKVCEKAGLPCYTDMKTWDLCANKDVFKSYCRKFSVDCTPEYEIDENTPDEALSRIDYPIILKPVDRSSSAGITVCNNKDEVRKAYKTAMDASDCKRIIAEKYIENGGEIFSVRYMLKDGEVYPYFLMDTYVADPFTRKSLISAYTYAPSKYYDYYMNNMDKNVRKMLKGMGLKDGTAFIQALPCNGKIYFHEMGYRLSGGMIFKLTEPCVGINDMKMMIRYALNAEIFDAEEMAKVDIKCSKNKAAQLMIPLSAGKIAKIENFDEVMKLPYVQDFIRYYDVGDVIEQSVLGTLGQHFGRFTMIAKTEKELIDATEYIQNNLKIIDENGNVMNVMKFDLSRIQHREIDF